MINKRGLILFLLLLILVFISGCKQKKTVNEIMKDTVIFDDKYYSCISDCEGDYFFRDATEKKDILLCDKILDFEKKKYKFYK